MSFDFLNSFMFHPRESGQPISDKDILIDVDDDIKIGSRFHLSNADAPTIIFFHGNGEIVPEYDDIAIQYNRRNINFIPVDYRGYGHSSGVPNPEIILRDSRTVFTYIKNELEQKNYTGPVFIMGRSLGSTCALEIASNFKDEIDGLIIESGFATEYPFFQLMGISPESIGFEEKHGFQNRAKAQKYSGPLLVMHAEQDHIVPFKEGELLFEESPSTKKRFKSFPNADHNNILFLYSQEFFFVVEKFLRDNS